MNYSSVSLTLVVHLTFIYINLYSIYIYILYMCTFMCTSRSKIDVDRKKMRKKRKKKKDEEEREKNRRAATMYHALRSRSVIFYFHFCSFPLFFLSRFSSLLSLLFFSSRVCHESCSKKKRSSSFPFL